MSCKRRLPRPIFHIPRPFCRRLLYVRAGPLCQTVLLLQVLLSSSLKLSERPAWPFSLPPRPPRRRGGASPSPPPAGRGRGRRGAPPPPPPPPRRPPPPTRSSS